MRMIWRSLTKWFKKIARVSPQAVKLKSNERITASVTSVAGRSAPHMFRCVIMIARMQLQRCLLRVTIHLLRQRGVRGRLQQPIKPNSGKLWPKNKLNGWQDLRKLSKLKFRVRWISQAWAIQAIIHQRKRRKSEPQTYRLGRPNSYSKLHITSYL